MYHSSEFLKMSVYDTSWQNFHKQHFCKKSRRTWLSIHRLVFAHHFKTSLVQQAATSELSPEWPTKAATITRSWRGDTTTVLVSHRCVFKGSIVCRVAPTPVEPPHAFSSSRSAIRPTLSIAAWLRNNCSMATCVNSRKLLTMIKNRIMY